MKTPLHPARRFLTRFGRPHLILPVSFLNSMAFTIVGLGLVFYLRDRFGATAGTIGLAPALFSSLYFIGCFVLRPLTTTILPRYSLVISSLLSAAGIGGLLLASSPAAIIVVYGTIGFALAMFWPPVMGWLSAGVDGQFLNREISRFNTAWSIGVILGPYLAGLMTEVDVRLPLVVGGAIMVFNAVVIGLASIFVRTVRDDRYLESPPGFARGPDASTPLRFPAWVAVVAAYATLGAIMVIVPLFGRDVLGLSESNVGLALLTRGLAATTVFVVMGRTSRWHFRVGGFPVPLAVLVLALVGLIVSRSGIAFALLLAFVGAAVAGAYTYSVFHGAAGSVDRTRRMAVHEALLTVGNVVGAAGGGLLYQHFGIRGALIFCAGIVAAALALQGILLVRPRPVSSAPGAAPPA